MVSAAPDIVAGKAGRIMTRKAPEIIDVTEQRFEELLQRAESNTLRDDDMELMREKKKTEKRTLNTRFVSPP